MRVLMVGPAPDVPGGVGSLVRLLLSNPPEGVEYELVPTIVGRTSIEAYRGFNTRYLVGAVQNLRHFLRALRAIEHRVWKESFDIAHIHFSVAGSLFRKVLVARLLRQHNIVYLLHAHGGRFDIFYRKLPTILKKQVIHFIEGSTGLIVLSTAMRSFYCSLAPLRGSIFMLPNPVLLPEELPTRPETSRLRLIFLGRLGSHKGSDRVLRAVSLLPEKLRAHVEIWMAGDGEVETTRALAESLGLSQQVRVSEWIDSGTRDGWLRESHVMILPSRAEGVPMALLEGMAWGLPVISSPVGGIPDIVTDGQEGFLVPPDDIPAISQAIQRFVEDRNLLQEMGWRARLRAESHSLEKYRERLKAVYETVLERSSQASHRVDGKIC